MALDGIENIQGDCLIYTDGLLQRVEAAFDASLPKCVRLADADETIELLIREIILKAGK